MRTPGPDDLIELRGKSSSYFACWLALGLQKYLFDRVGRCAFPGAVHFIEQQDDITEDLKLIGKALNSRDLEAFREACVGVFQALDLTKEQEIIMGEKVLRLCVKIHASGILVVLNERAISFQSTGAASKLHYLAKEVVRDLTP